MKEKLRPGKLPASVLFIFHFFSFQAFSQTVIGKVSDADGKSIQDISVQMKGTTTGTSTNAAGQYSVVAASNAVLVFSSVGYTSQEVPVSGRSVVNIILVNNNKDLGEVVVTALGITKQARGIGYSATNVKSDDLTINRSSNPLNTLQGKVAGVNISALGTGPGGSSKIRIRGQSSIGGQNNPLIVINGVPIDNTNFNENTNGVKGGGITSDGGDGLSSINPDDIENMTILKGAPAAALYGSRAKDGVIMITTKIKGTAVFLYTKDLLFLQRVFLYT